MKPMRVPILSAMGVFIVVGGAAVYGWLNSNTPGPAAEEFLPEPDLAVIDSTIWVTDGIRTPAVSDGTGGRQQDQDRVIGVVVAGEARAYCLGAMDSPDTHVVNDLIAETPISITYCDQTDCARVFTDTNSKEPLSLQIGGMHEEMLLRIDGVFYPHLSDKIPLEDVEFERTTWGEWRKKYPDTKVFAGPVVVAPSQLPATPAFVVRAYLDAPRWNDRLPFVSNREQVAQLMQKTYADQWLTASYGKIVVDAEWPRGERRIATVHNYQAFQQRRPTEVNYVVVREGDEYKIDWEASLGKNGISVADFVASQRMGTHQFRLLCAIDDLYVCEFLHQKDEYLSLRMYDTDPGRNSIQGYVKRKSAEGRALSRLLRDGRVRPVTLQLANLTRESVSSADESCELDTVAVVGIVRESF